MDGLYPSESFDPSLFFPPHHLLTFTFRSSFFRLFISPPARFRLLHSSTPLCLSIIYSRICLAPSPVPPSLFDAFPFHLCFLSSLSPSLSPFPRVPFHTFLNDSPPALGTKNVTDNSYPLPPSCEDTEILRVVVRESLSGDLARKLLADIIQV